MIAAALLMTAALAEPVGKSPEVAMRAASITSYLGYEDCVRNKTTIAGAFTKVEPRDVARAAEPKCATEWREFRGTILTGVEPSAADIQSLEYYRSLAIGGAASGLVEARHGSCGTEPGPLACWSK